MQLNDRYAPDPAIVARDIAGEMILVPIRQSVGDLDSIYTLNETAAYIWAQLDGQRALADVRDSVIAEFEVEAAEAERDLLELIAQLESVGAVRQV